MMQGAVGVSGPIIGSWLYAHWLPRDSCILSLSVPFLITGVAQINTPALIGAYNPDRLIAAAVGFGPVLAALPSGSISEPDCRARSSIGPCWGCCRPQG